jgi:hypothetical protein
MNLTSSLNPQQLMNGRVKILAKTQIDTKNKYKNHANYEEARIWGARAIQHY